MADLADFLPDVLPWCVGVSAPLAERAVLHAAREFCEYTGWWRSDELFTTVTDESATGEYALTLATGTALVSVLNPIWHASVPVYLKPAAWLTENYTKDWRTKTGEQADFFTMTAKATVRLVPYPTTAVADDLRVTKILKPALTSPTVDDTVLDDWSEAIGWGAVARLKAQPGQAWSDQNDAAAKLLLFEEAKQKAKSKAVADWQDRNFQRNRRVAGHHF
ncbi:MAG: hypothetical protein H6948_02200 [Zoogloeaceae bacterium]|nr:hypothetical protein [Zoogloeaceae bacterium]